MLEVIKKAGISLNKDQDETMMDNSQSKLLKKDGTVALGGDGDDDDRDDDDDNSSDDSDGSGNSDDESDDDNGPDDDKSDDADSDDALDDEIKDSLEEEEAANRKGGKGGDGAAEEEDKNSVEERVFVCVGRMKKNGQKQAVWVMTIDQDWGGVTMWNTVQHKETILRQRIDEAEKENLRAYLTPLQVMKEQSNEQKKEDNAYKERIKKWEEEYKEKVMGINPDSEGEEDDDRNESEDGL